MEINYKLFPHCIPVKGVSRSIVCNLHNGSYFFITNDLYNILNEYKTLNIEELGKDFGIENLKILQDYISVLLNNGCLFELNKKESEKFFPKFSLEFQEASLLDNAIIDISKKTELSRIVEKLESMGCIAILLRVTYKINYDELKKLLEVFTNSSVQHLDILISKTNFIKDEILEKLFYSQVRLNSITIYSSKIDHLKKVEFEKSIIGYIRQISKKFNISNHCPSIDPSFFVLNTLHFTESIKFNNCLNKKIAIDIEGNIKNCPSMKKTFGNVKTLDLNDLVISNNSFKELWSVKKDDIKVCNGCEFRYICSDCRAFLENPKDVTSKPLMCGYDPVSETWSSWSENPLKEAAIEHYFKDLVDD